MAEKKFAVDLNLLYNELKSARIENLAADPSTLYGGLFWFNLTESALKYSNGTEVFTLAVGSNVDTAVANLQAYVDQKIAEEVTGRNDAITTAVTGESAARDTAIATAISAEQADRSAAIDAAIVVEQTARDSAIASAVGAAISTEQTDRDTAIASAITNARSDITSEINAAIDSDVINRDAAITAAINAEVTARDTAIADAVTVERTARESAIAAEQTARDSAFAAEAALRTSGDADTLAEAKTYADSVASGLSGGFNGDFDASLGTLPTGTFKAGSYWRVSLAGTVPGLSPVASLEIGDMLICRVSTPTTAADFFALQGNLSDSVSSSVGSVIDGEIAAFSGTSGKIVKSSGITFDNLAKVFRVEAPIVAGTPLQLTISGSVEGLALGSAVQVYLATGEEVIMGVTKAGSTITVRSNVSFDGITVVVTAPGKAESISVTTAG